MKSAITRGISLLNLLLAGNLLGSINGLAPINPQRRILPSLRSLRSRPSTTRCNLFFQQPAQALTVKKKRTRIPSWAFETLILPDTPLPFQFCLEETNDNPGNAIAQNSLVTIRSLTAEDLTTIVPMCLREFGGDAKERSITYLLQKIPWNSGPGPTVKFIQEWFETAALPFFIYGTFRLKIAQRNAHDHSLLVATVQPQQPQPQPKPQNDNPKSSQSTELSRGVVSKEVLVGMVELSQQPPDPHRNPTAFPLPIWYKQAYCLFNNLPPLNGWVTNLLIDPAHRSQGYSKLLMKAVEGVAKRWGCTAIHLHCDADPVSGKVPQNLYGGLGYEMVQDLESPFAWMGSQFSNKIYMVQGVALLYMRKNLNVTMVADWRDEKSHNATQQRCCKSELFRIQFSWHIPHNKLWCCKSSSETDKWSSLLSSNDAT